MSHSSRIVYLNGQFLPVEQATVSVMDRGFLFGDGVYEVIPIFNSRFFLPKRHLQRLKRSLTAVEIDFAVDEDQLLALFEELLQRNTEQGDTQVLYVQITRGAALNRDHLFPEGVKPTLFAQCTAVKPLTEAEMRQGSHAITVQDTRWAWCYIKAITLLPNVLSAQHARQVGAREAILLRDGVALEGCSSNLFIVKDGVIITPPANYQILGGVTRDIVLELARSNQMPVKEASVTENMLRHADEVWMTGSVKEVLPITQLDDKPVGTGKVGAVWEKMQRLYQDAKKNLIQ
ncbi:MAG TPA: aminotransferase class IV [Gammaproteobacteria bacterium]|nr:aminotransferase class IV [Gammaproteobacteria bacterium]